METRSANKHLRCIDCKKGKPESEMDVGYAYMGKNTNSEHLVSHWLGNMNFYRMSPEAIELPVCKECVKNELIQYILIATGMLIGGSLLLLFAWIYKWHFFAVFIGGVFATTGVAIFTKMKLTKENMADTIAVKSIKSKIPNSTLRKEKIEILTREEYTKLMPHF